MILIKNISEEFVIKPQRSFSTNYWKHPNTMKRISLNLLAVRRPSES